MRWTVVVGVWYFDFSKIYLDFCAKKKYLIGLTVLNVKQSEGSMMLVGLLISLRMVWWWSSNDCGYRWSVKTTWWSAMVCILSKELVVPAEWWVHYLWRKEFVWRLFGSLVGVTNIWELNILFLVLHMKTLDVASCEVQVILILLEKCLRIYRLNFNHR